MRLRGQGGAESQSGVGGGPAGSVGAAGAGRTHALQHLRPHEDGGAGGRAVRAVVVIDHAVRLEALHGAAGDVRERVVLEPGRQQKQIAQRVQDVV